MVFTRSLGQAGGLPTVLAHCFLGNSGGWRGLVEALETPLDALAFDLPGHGRTPMPADPGDLSAGVAALIDGFAARPSLIVGHSFGGVAALRFALRNPARVLGLVLIEPVFIAAALARGGFSASAQEAAYAIAAREGRLEEAARLFYAFNDPTRDWAALPEAARQVMSAQMALLPATEPGAVADSGQLLAPGLMESFPAPVLLLGGERSPPLFPAILDALAERLPGARRETIAGAGHMLPITHPGDCARAMDRWLRDHRLVPGKNATERAG